jgi:hypothetical protein
VASKVTFRQLAEYVKTRFYVTATYNEIQSTSSKPVSIATVDRELSKARKIFGVALSKKWVFDNPFKMKLANS